MVLKLGVDVHLAQVTIGNHPLAIMVSGENPFSYFFIFKYL
jgi:hypothetical protein